MSSLMNVKTIIRSLTLLASIISFGQSTAYAEDDVVTQISPRKTEGKFNDEWTDSMINTLVSFKPSPDQEYQSYVNKPSLYMFCRNNREYPCLMVMKDRNGNWVKTKNGDIWSQPKLAMSARGIEATKENGETPQGVYLLNSVMPEADKKILYGKYRRVIMDFIPMKTWRKFGVVGKRQYSEEYLYSFLPPSLRNLKWWQEGRAARNVGRHSLRIHGTLIPNPNEDAPYYTFFPTAGCIASREGFYKGVEFKDQRELLDVFMMAQGLNVKRENETSIKGLLYVVNINNEEKAVELTDIEAALE